MIIRHMKAVFGALDGRELALKAGMNVIHAPNESGKSTWCAFIRAMLYGVDTAERERAGHKPDKLKFAPWNGSAMAGEMDIESAGGLITLRRTGKAGAPMRDFLATYTGTGDPVPGISGQNAGERLTGVTRAVFERSAFIRQSGIAFGANPELARAVASVVATGEEDTSYAEADEKLRAWQRKRRYNNRGTIPELEAGESLLRQRLRELQSAGERRLELEDKAERAAARRDELQHAAIEQRKIERRDALERMSRAQSEMKARLTELDEASSLAAFRQSELRHSLFGVKPPEELKPQVGRDEERARTLSGRANSARGNIPVIVLALFCFGAACAGAACLALGLEPFPGLGYFGSAMAAFSAGALFLLADIFSIVKTIKGRRAARTAQAELDELLARYGAANPDGISDSLRIHESLWNLYVEARLSKEAKERELEAARARQKEQDAQLLRDLDFGSGEGEAARLGTRLSAQEEELRRLREELAQCAGELRARGDPLALESELLSLRQKREEQIRQYEALSLAVETLREANSEIQSRFSPKLGRRAGELMSALTGGRYRELRVNKDLEVQTRLESDAAGREAAFLSEGAASLMYLALRIAVCELALPPDDPCPLILDDALVYLDDNRLGAALSLLADIAKDRQVILFTCHERETELLADREDVNIARLI